VFQPGSFLKLVVWLNCRIG